MTERSTPVEVAIKRFVRMHTRTSKDLERLQPFADDAVAQVATALENLQTHLAELPENFRPKRNGGSRRTRNGALEEGAIYQIKEKYQERYASTAGGDASFAVVENVLADGNVVVTFANETSGIVKQAHLGEKVSGDES